MSCSSAGSVADTIIPGGFKNETQVYSKYSRTFWGSGTACYTHADYYCTRSDHSTSYSLQGVHSVSYCTRADHSDSYYYTGADHSDTCTTGADHSDTCTTGADHSDT